MNTRSQKRNEKTASMPPKKAPAAAAAPADDDGSEASRESSFEETEGDQGQTSGEKTKEKDQHKGDERPTIEEQRAVAAFKVPQFESERADKFFFLCEDRFTAIGIYNPSLRASCVMEYFPSTLVEMLTARFPEFAAAADKYQAIKQAVLEYSQRPLWARMQMVDSLPSVNPSMSPTQLMCRMLALKSPSEPFSEKLKYDFMKRLPQNLFDKYKTRRWEDPMAFAVKTEADWQRSIAPDRNPRPAVPEADDRGKEANVNSIPVEPAAERPESDMELSSMLQPLVAVLQRVVQRGQPAGRRPGRGWSRGGGQSFRPYPAPYGRGSSRGRGYFNNQGAENSTNQRAPRQDWCFFHQRFGQGAWSCRQPCSFNRRTQE